VGDTVEMTYRCTLRDKDYWGEDADEFHAYTMIAILGEFERLKSRDDRP
jgi:hypothetical protein